MKKRYFNRKTHDPSDVNVEVIDISDFSSLEEFIRRNPELSMCVDCQTDPCSCPYCMVCGLDWDDCQDWTRPPE